VSVDAAVAPTPEQRAAGLRLMIFDVDGVLTDGRLNIGADGEVFKVFHVRDGHGIKLLQAGGVRCAILSARRSEIVNVRARELGIEHVQQGAHDKAAGYAALRDALGLADVQCGFIGDDWPDLVVLRQVGFAASVADATPEAREAAHWISSRNGGHGAVRELAEFVLRAQGRFAALLAREAGAPAGA
jgi:3-deoxy-D-manno-octulosonate 8-phosphate phosphatase (KDO 8-P phosphatase)